RPLTATSVAGVSRRAYRRAYRSAAIRKCCWLRPWIVFRLWMSGVFQLLGTLRNKLRCTLRHLRQQLRHSLRASEISLRRTVRTDFLLRVSAPCLNRLPNNSRAHPLGRKHPLAAARSLMLMGGEGGGGGGGGGEGEGRRFARRMCINVAYCVHQNNEFAFCQ